MAMMFQPSLGSVFFQRNAGNGDNADEDDGTDSVYVLMGISYRFVRSCIF